MKRGLIALVICLSLVLILSSSLVSAGAFTDILQRILGIQVEPASPFTGRATGGSVSCLDLDGPDNFSAEGYVSIDGGTATWDFCEGNIAYDTYCCNTETDPNCVLIGDPPCQPGDTDCDPPSLRVVLPLITNGITGYPTYSGNYVPASTTKNCMSTLGVPCSGLGVCGCTAPKSCAEPGLVVCQTGTAACLADGTYGSCQGAVYVGQTCSDGLICQPNGQCGGLPPSCTDNDGDGYGNPGSSTCQLGSQTDCDDSTSGDPIGCPTNPSQCSSTTSKCAICINHGATETCDGVDNNCVSGIDEGTGLCSSGLVCSQGQCQAPSPTCGNGIIGSGEECDGSNLNNKTCLTQGFIGGTLSCKGDCTFNTSACTSTRPPVPCTDEDRDGFIVESSDSTCTKPGNFAGYGDCDDSDADIYPGADEVCDNVDNDCNNEIDEGLVTVLTCKTSSTNSSCQQKEAGCVSGVDKDSCADFSLVTPSGNDCGDLNDTVDDEEEGQVCGGKTISTCGTNTGTCYVGVRYCTNGAWGECKNEGKPTDEVCGDSLDNDCDGQIDEGCGVTTGTTSGSTGGSQDGSSSSTGTGSDSEDSESDQAQESDSFWKKIGRFFLAILRVGKVVLSPITGNPVAEIQKPCSDSDGGINYFVKGSGSGTSNSNEIWFQDVCYEDSINNQVGSCAGENCFLSEKYCQGTEIKTEPSVICQFGCVKGACVPESESRGECEPYFDKDLFEWVDPC